jgi:hypothetical protein
MLRHLELDDGRGFLVRLPLDGSEQLPDLRFFSLSLQTFGVIACTLVTLYESDLGSFQDIFREDLGPPPISLRRSNRFSGHYFHVMPSSRLDNNSTVEYNLCLLHAKINPISCLHDAQKVALQFSYLVMNHEALNPLPASSK